MPAPGFYSQDLEDVPFLLSGEGKVGAGDVLLASGQTSSLTPAYRIPPGTVVVKKTADGKYYQADDASNGDRNTAPSITSSGHTDNAANDIVLVGNHGTITVTMSTGTGTEANNATDLNADQAFAANYIASSAGGELTITSLHKGPGEWFYVDATTNDDFGFAEGEANKVQGTEADYRVTNRFGHLEDLDGTAVDDLVGTYYAGHFKRSLLSNLTAEAEAVLLRRGSRIE